jgi:hypothetical protein
LTSQKCVDAQLRFGRQSKPTDAIGKHPINARRGSFAQVCGLITGELAKSVFIRTCFGSTRSMNCQTKIDILIELGSNRVAGGKFCR